MRKREKLNKIVCGLDKSLKEDEIIVAFEYDLTKTDSPERVDGIIAVGGERIIVFENGEKRREYKLSEAKEFKSSLGVGCVFVEFKSGDESVMLCRADNSYSKLYAAVAKRLNRYLDAKKYTYEYEEHLTGVCEKCGRPIRPGQTVCEHCVPKVKYL